MPARQNAWIVATGLATFAALSSIPLPSPASPPVSLQSPPPSFSAQQPPDDDDDDSVIRQLTVQRTVQENCLICHEEGMISQQRLSPAQWKSEVEKMVSWGAPLAASDQASVIEYLAQQYPASRQRPSPRLIALQHMSSLEPIVNRSIATVPGDDTTQGALLYKTNCANCHGADARGAELGPALVNKAVLTYPDTYRSVIQNGLRRMPGFRNTLNSTQEHDVLRWLRGRTYP